MNKKSILVFITATILAFLAVFLVFENNKKNIKTSPVENTRVQIEETNFEETIEENSINIKEEEEKKVVETPVKKPESKPKQALEKAKTTTPDIKLIKVEEAKKQEIFNKEEKQDSGIVKDIESDDIVITREFKFESPAKYSFK